MLDIPTRNKTMLPVYIALLILIIFVVLFLISFIRLSEDEGGVSDNDLTADTYMDIVTLLLERANPENAPALLAHYACTGCHRDGGIAPEFSNLMDVAGERHPPLSAPAYIYESIIYPQAYTVEGIDTIMPHLFAPPRVENGELVFSAGDSEADVQDLADIIAYLLSGDAE